MFLGLNKDGNIVYLISFSGKPWIGSGQLTTDKHARDVPFLNTYAKERWEVCCVYYIVPLQLHPVMYLFETAPRLSVRLGNKLSFQGNSG